MKISSSVRTLTLCSTLLCSLIASAAGESIESSGLKYNILSEETRQAAVIGFTEEATSFIVPASITVNDVEYTVTEIADQAFENCNSLQTIELPNTITAIRYMAFGHCGSLKEFTMPQQLTTVENWVFEACTSLKKVEFSPALTFLGYHVFDGCSALEEVDLPDSMEEILSHTFNGCTSLKSVKLPKNLKALGESAFFECKSLVYVPIPDSLTELSNTVFGLCSSLTDITIPASISSIGIGAFDSCYALKNIYVMSANPPLAYKSTFNRLEAKLINVYVPQDSRYSYAFATGWSIFPDFIGMKTITDKDFVLETGASLQLEATVPADISAEWSSSNPEIARVDSNGLLKAVSPGTATVSLMLTDAFGVKSVQEATVTVSGSTSIEDIECGINSNEEYYSISGVKSVASEKTPGLYIRIRDGKAERIIIH